MSNQKVSLTAALKNTKEIAITAGKILCRYQKKLSELNVTSKAAQGVVSEADIETEKSIFKNLRKLYPDFSFLGEESAYEEFEGEKEALQFYAKKEWCWIVDPLDGTNNFLAGSDYYGVCIALAHRGKPVLGIVYRPKTGEFFSAIKGEGAFVSNLVSGKRAEKLQVSSHIKKIQNSILVTGFATEKKGPVFEDEFQNFRTVLISSRGIRRFGSAALDLCYVAQGQWQGFWERNLSPWDVAAAGLICQEAGGVVTNYQGEKFSPFHKTIVSVANRSLFRQLSQILIKGD